LFGIGTAAVTEFRQTLNSRLNIRTVDADGWRSKKSKHFGLFDACDLYLRNSLGKAAFSKNARDSFGRWPVIRAALNVQDLDLHCFLSSFNPPTLGLGTVADCRGSSFELHLSNELHPLDVLRTEKTESPLVPGGCCRSRSFFVEPYGIYGQARLVGYFSNMEGLNVRSHAHGRFTKPEYTLE
jgi:hypothetical protein